MRNRGWARCGLIAGVWLAANGALLAQGQAQGSTGACTAKNEADRAVVKGFTFVTYKNDEGTCLQVLSEGKVVYTQPAEAFETLMLGQPGDGSVDVPAIANGVDVTGRGQPDMIVSGFSGGAHCCTAHWVFELAPRFRLLATLNDADDDLAHFERDPKDGRYNYVTGDWTFGYWPTCFACSPSEVVVLRWADDAEGGGFHLALDKMQKPAPTQARWNKDLSDAKKAVTAGDANSIGTTMWQTVLDLLYTGHSDLAWKFVDTLGPRAQLQPFPALSDFCALLKQSPYWPDLQPALKDTPPACANAGAKKAQ